jgi:alkanesulfonate monooxygenase SsuD/methylene tetrahydromethanopterin reductase-like flavin-dependent oxidoreductase (luciferase family)
MPRPLPDARALLPVVRRLMTTGAGPPGLADWAARYGLTPGHGPPDDPTARRLADRLAEAVRAGLTLGSALSSRDTVPIPCGPN